MRTESRPESSIRYDDTDISGFKECFRGGKLHHFIFTPVYVGSTVIMRPTRRKTLVGLGALATGSGALFSSAAFSNSVNPSSDMRVVVDEELTLEPGILFRDGNSADDTFDPSASSPPGSETLQDQSSNSLFGGNNNAGLANIGVDDIPAAAINDEVDGNLFLEVAVALGETGTIGDGSNGVFQVRNDTSDSQDIAIRFDTFGPDADGDTNDLSEQQVVETFQFFDSSGNQISTDDPTPSQQTVDNVVTVSPGNVEQIYVDYDTAAYQTALETAAGITGNPFNQQTATVDLVDTISVGVEDGTNVSP